MKRFSLVTRAFPGGMIRVLPALILLLAGAAQALPPERVLFDENFSATPGQSPYAWQPLEGNWLIAQRTTKVLRQENDDVTAESWTLALWANYSIVTKCLAEEGDGPWGLGVTAYDDGLGHAYRLRLGEGRLYLEKVDGADVRILADVEATAARGAWFSLRLTCTTSATETALKGKLWNSADDEPKDWQIKELHRIG